jgi:hypothetical protein
MKDTEVKKKLVELAEGVYVESDVLNVVEKIRAYDPNLRVKYCDPARSAIGDAPYKIVEVCPDGFERVVFDVWVLDETVLERLHAADNQKHDILSRLDGANLFAKRNEARRYEEQKLEAKDIVSSYLSSPKGRWSFRDSVTGKTVEIDDQEKRSYRVVKH